MIVRVRWFQLDPEPPAYDFVGGIYGSGFTRLPPAQRSVQIHGDVPAYESDAATDLADQLRPWSELDVSLRLSVPTPGFDSPLARFAKRQRQAETDTLEMLAVGLFAVDHDDEGGDERWSDRARLGALVALWVHSDRRTRDGYRTRARKIGNFMKLAPAMILPPDLAEAMRAVRLEVRDEG